MAISITPVLDPHPKLPWFPGGVPDVTYVNKQVVVQWTSIVVRKVQEIVNPCIGAGKGCSCPCCAHKASMRPTVTHRKHCRCYGDILWGRNLGGKSPRELHGCDCYEDETHEMSNWEAVFYAMAEKDENGNVIIEC